MEHNLDKTNFEEKIPYLIHQIWFQGEEEIPIKYNTFRKGWKDLTNFKYEFWDETRIKTMMDFFPEYKRTYDSFPTMIQKIDFAKYIILFIYGGVYIDMDVFPVGDFLNSFMQNNSERSFIVFEHNTPYITITMNKLMGLDGTRIINNAVIFSSSRNKRLVDIIHACQYSQDNWKKNCLSLQLRCLVTTGPIVFTNCIRKTPGWRECVFEPEIFEPFTTLELVKMSDSFLKYTDDGSVDYNFMMLYLKNVKNISGTVGIHVLDLSWFKDGKDNWKFRAFKKVQKVKTSIRTTLFNIDKNIRKQIVVPAY